MVSSRDYHGAVSGIDLHAHTIYSDGTFTPAEAIALAVDRGLSVLSISDHDSTEGLREAEAAAEATPVEVVPGVELSAVHDGGPVHLLCYWPDLGAEELQGELRRLREDRWTRGRRMVEKLQSLGYPVTFERVSEIAEGDNVGRPHLAQALVEAGVVPELKDAFSDELIGTGGRAYVEKHALPSLDALALVKRAGGIAVLAHPGLRWRRELPVPDDLIERMAEAGLDGLEVDHPDHDALARVRYREMAHRLGLVATGSSDCHGTRYDPVRMGSETTDPQEFARLKARKGL
jgi:predicted metal-dependent phosphoesterase TrpH